MNLCRTSVASRYLLDARAIAVAHLPRRPKRHVHQGGAENSRVPASSRAEGMADCSPNSTSIHALYTPPPIESPRIELICVCAFKENSLCGARLTGRRISLHGLRWSFLWFHTSRVFPAPVISRTSARGQSPRTVVTVSRRRLMTVRPMRTEVSPSRVRLGEYLMPSTTCGWLGALEKVGRGASHARNAIESE